MRRAVLYASGALACALGVLAIAAGGIAGLQDQVRCRFMLDRNEPNTTAAWIHVSPDRQGELIRYARSFAERHDMMFETQVWEPGSAGIGHRNYVIEACNRYADLSIRNTDEAASFGIYSSRNPNYDPDTFNRLYSDFVRGATERFGAATDHP